jgi:DNA-binding CsgD family transcriptional regulator
MGTSIFALAHPAERVYQALRSLLESMRSTETDDQQDVTRAIVRVSLHGGAPVNVGGAVLPLMPVSAKALHQRYRLSRTQALVAELLSGRLTNAEIAAVLGCAENTARTHVGQVFALLNVRRREEVVYLLSDPSLYLDASTSDW